MIPTRLLLVLLTIAGLTCDTLAATKKGTSKATSKKSTATKTTAKKKAVAKKPAPKPAEDKKEGEETEKPAAAEETAKKDGEEKPDAEEGKESADGLKIFARAAMVMDSQTGDVIYEKNADALEYPASATKILTGLLVIEAGDLDKLVTVEESDTKVEPSSLELKPGEQYPRRHLLYALLLKSANDVAMALARDNAGSVEAFAKKMTDRALALGAESSHFQNPHGLHDPHHYTTARDLARIARAAMQNPLFREVVSTRDVWMLKADQWIFFKNHNKLLARLPGCIGVKTGYTRAAQQVLVSAAARDGKEAISVVLHTNKPGIWDDSELLLKHGLTKLTAPPPPAPTEPVPGAPEPTPPPAEEAKPTGAAANGQPAGAAN